MSADVYSMCHGMIMCPILNWTGGDLGTDAIGLDEIIRIGLFSIINKTVMFLQVTKLHLKLLFAVMLIVQSDGPFSMSSRSAL